MINVKNKMPCSKRGIIEEGKEGITPQALNSPIYIRVKAANTIFPMGRPQKRYKQRQNERLKSQSTIKI